MESVHEFLNFVMDEIVLLDSNLDISQEFGY